MKPDAKRWVAPPMIADRNLSAPWEDEKTAPHDHTARAERRDAAEHRRAILAAARRLFAERGVDAVAMHQIAQAAAVGQGTLYRRYAHKGLLCMALLEESMTRLRRETEALLRRPDAALAHLDTLLVALGAFREENAPLLGAVADAACGERRSALYCLPFYTWLRDTLVALLERAVATGEARPLDVACTADAILASLSIDLYLHQRRTQGFSHTRITAALRSLYVDGLRAGKQ